MSRQVPHWLSLRPCYDDHSNHKSVTPLIWLPLPSAYGSQRPPWLTRLHVSQPCSPTVAHSSICSIWSLPSSLFLQHMSTSPSSELCLGCSFYPKLFPFHLFLSPTHYSGLILDVTMQRGFHEPLRPGWRQGYIAGYDFSNHIPF